MKNIIILFLTAIIWGLAFVAQKAGMKYIGPFAFNGMRFILGTLSLLPLLVFQKQLFGTSVRDTDLSFTLKGGIVLGVFLFIAAAFQQVGVVESTAGNAGFITSLYIILVPFISIFIRHKISPEEWIGALLAAIGLYFLSINQQFKMSPGDGLVLISAFFWASHILLIGYYAPKTNILLLSIIQFSIGALLNLFVAFWVEEINFSMITDALYPILYGGIMSIGIAYTLQAVGQRNIAPSKAAIILSFESIFALLGGWLLLNESITFRKTIGATIMLTGLIISQIKITSLKNRS